MVASFEKSSVEELRDMRRIDCFKREVCVSMCCVCACVTAAVWVQSLAQELPVLQMQPEEEGVEEEGTAAEEVVGCYPPIFSGLDL